MDRLKKSLSNFSDALRRFEESIIKIQNCKNSENYSFFRDSAIQRFEFTFEIMWKTMKVFLEREGIRCASPRACIRELFTTGYIKEETARELLKMLNDRNLTVHTYREEIAEDIANRLGDYVKTLRKLESIFKKEVSYGENHRH